MLTFTEQPVTKLVREMSFRDYCASDGINNSSLSWFDEWSGGAPAKYRFYALHPEHRPEPTQALEDGSCYHHFVLQPDSFDRFYVVRTAEVEEECYALAVAGAGRTGTKSKAKGFSPLLSTYKDWVSAREAEGRLVITQKRADELRWMRDALLSDPEVKDECLFAPGSEMELSAFCGYEFKRGTYEGKRFQLKARMDHLPPTDAIIDLKSARSANARDFARQCWNLNYHRAGAWYSDVANVNGLERKRFGFLAQDKFPPYLPAIHWVNSWLPHGRIRYEMILSELAKAIATNSWPGYGAGELMPPSYAEAELEAAA